MPYGIQTNLTQLPPWYEALYRTMGEQAAAQRQVPYQAYRSPRLAQLPQDINRSFELTRGSLGAYLPYIEAGRNRLNTAAGKFPQHAQEYMNPYVQNVLNRIRTESGQFLNEKVLPALESHFVASGAPRSGQHLNMIGQAGRDVQRDMEERQRSYLSHAYENAGRDFTADQARQVKIAEDVARLGQLSQAGNLADVAALQEQGRIQQQQKQAELEVPYQDFLRQQNYPWEQLHQQNAILQGMPASTQTTGVTQTPATPQVNTMGQLGALAGSLYGSRMFAGKKRGGHIKAKNSNIPKHSSGLSSLKFKPQKRLGRCR